MVVIKDRRGRPHRCYADKTFIPREIIWAVISPELKRFYADMAAKGSTEFSRELELI